MTEVHKKLLKILYEGEKSNVWYTPKQLVRSMEVSYRTIQRYLFAIRKEGWILPIKSSPRIMLRPGKMKEMNEMFREYEHIRIPITGKCHLCGESIEASRENYCELNFYYLDRSGETFKLCEPHSILIRDWLDRERRI